MRATRMRRRLVVRLVFVAIIAGQILYRAPVASAAGLCGLASHGNYHVVLNKFASDIGASYFDLARGEMTIRQPDVCVGAGNGATWMLGANIETATGSVVQLGYGQFAGESNPKFIYAHGSTAGIAWPNSYSPIVGNRYRFSITRVVEPGGLTDTDYLIQDLTGGTSSFLEVSGWFASLNHAWWGAET